MKPIPLQQFHKAFKQRDLALAKHLIDDDPDTIDLHGGREYFFCVACKRGWLESAQWLRTLEKSHGRIDIHVRDEGPFRWACRRQDFVMLRWLRGHQSLYRADRQRIVDELVRHTQRQLAVGNKKAKTSE